MCFKFLKFLYILNFVIWFLLFLVINREIEILDIKKFVWIYIGREFEVKRFVFSFYVIVFLC